MVIIGGLGSIMGSFFGAAFIVVLPIAPPTSCCPASARGVPPDISTTGVSHAEAHDLRGLIVVVPDRRAPWAGQAVVHRQAEAAPVARSRTDPSDPFNPGTAVPPRCGSVRLLPGHRSGSMPGGP